MVAFAEGGRCQVRGWQDQDYEENWLQWCTFGGKLNIGGGGRVVIEPFAFSHPLSSLFSLYIVVNFVSLPLVSRYHLQKKYSKNFYFIYQIWEKTQKNEMCTCSFTVNQQGLDGRYLESDGQRVPNCFQKLIIARRPWPMPWCIWKEPVADPKGGLQPPLMSWFQA